MTSGAAIAVYARTSTAEQSVSLDEQARACCAYARARGRAVAGVYVDEAVSGSTPFATRPAAAAILAAVSEGRVDGIVAVRLDRLFRSASDCLTAVTAWERRGLALHLVELGGQSVDTSSATGRLFVSMLASFAEFERNLIRDRTRSALRELKHQRRRTGTVPYGFRSFDGALCADEAEQSTVTRARQWRARGWTWEQVADGLNAAGVPRRNGRPWHRKAAQRCTDKREEPPR